MIFFFFFSADGRYYSNREERVNKPCQFFYHIPSYATFPFVSRCENASVSDDKGFGQKPAGYEKTVIAYDDGVIKDLATLDDYLPPSTEKPKLTPAATTNTDVAAPTNTDVVRCDSELKLPSVPIYLIILIAWSCQFYF